MKKILEIGGGTTPYFIRFDIPWKNGESYVCLDVNEQRLRESKNAVEALAIRNLPHPREVAFFINDGVDLPFDEGSHDEVVLSNVLSAPIHNNWDEKGETVTFKNPSGEVTRPLVGAGLGGDPFYHERKRVISEALRVLKAGGTLTIYTDLLIYGQHSYETILRELTSQMNLVHTADQEEQARIDALNLRKKAEGKFCYCFDADVLPASSVHRFEKKY